MEQHLDDMGIICANERDFDRLVKEVRIGMTVLGIMFVAMATGLMFR